MNLLKSFLQKFKTDQESGIALIQVLMMSVLLAGSITFSVLQNSKTTQKVSHDIYEQDLRQFVDRVQSVLANQDDCTDIVGGTAGFATLATGGSITPSTLSGGSSELKKFLEVTNAVSLLPSYGAQERILLTSMSIERTTLTDARLTLFFTINDTDVLGIREFAKIIPLVIIGTSTTVTACHANPDDMISDSVKRFCQGPGAVYDPDTHQCLLIGFKDQDCDPGKYVKGLSYDPSTLMVSPVCEAISGLTYDQVGCVGKAGSPIGFDADGKIICKKMTSQYIWPSLIDPYQTNLPGQECSTRIIKLRAFNNLYVTCVMPTQTPTPSPTTTATQTPSVTVTATPTITITPTPTYTDEGTPSPTPTEEPYCDFTGDPNTIWNAGMNSTGGTYLFTDNSFDDYICKTSAWDEEYEANLGLSGSAGYNPYQVVSEQCFVAVAVRITNVNFPTTHNHTHHVGESHKHCQVEIKPENLGTGKFTFDSWSFDLGHATSASDLDPCTTLANTAKRAPNWKIKVKYLFTNPLGTSPTTCTNPKQRYVCNSAVLPTSYVGTYDKISCLDPGWLNCYSGASYTNYLCWPTHYKKVRNGMSLHFYDGSSWTQFANMSHSNMNSTGKPYPFTFFGINKL